MITISEKALKQVVKLMEESNITTENNYLRVGVKGGGCSGLNYIMEFDDKVEIGTDEIFEAGSGIKILVNKKSLLYLWGTELDYSDGLNGKGFEWANPNSTRNCSCGSSFAV